MGAIGQTLEAAQQAKLSRARSRLENTGTVDHDSLSPHIAHSWERCIAAGLHPLESPHDAVLESSAFGKVLERHRIIRMIARPELDLLFRQVSGSHYALALGSPEGVVTDVLADAAFRDTDVGKMIIEGSLWQESVRGTNAMGLVLRDQAPRNVMYGEHFFRSQGEVLCIAAPIFGSRGNLAGVLDATTRAEQIHPHTTALLGVSAATIEASLFNHENDTATILRIHPRPEYLPTKSAGLIALDGQGAVMSLSRRAWTILRLQAGPNLPRLDDIFREGADAILQQLPVRSSLLGHLQDGFPVFVSCSQFRMRRFRPFGGTKIVRQQPEPTKKRLEDPHLIIGDLNLRRYLITLDRIIPSGAPIMISSESGTGKNAIAQYIHRRSGRSGPFIVVRCSGLTEADAVTSTFRGSGQINATSDLDGVFGAARDGTLFLDGVDELPELAQGALLKGLDDVDDATRWRVESGPCVQIISSVGSDIAVDSPDSRLRQDLYFRLNGFSVTLPPLRFRSDIDQLADFFLWKVAPRKKLDQSALKALREHRWPGNIRELRGTLKVASMLADSDTITQHDIMTAMQVRQPRGSGVAELPARRPQPCPKCARSVLRRERCVLIRETYLAESRNASNAARVLGIARSTLYEHIESLKNDGVAAADSA